MSTGQFEVIDHTADWALRIVGDDLRELMVQAALGMGYLMVGALDAVPKDVVRPIELEGYDAESLLVEWLTELAYWAETEQLVFSHIELTAVTANHLQGVVTGGYAKELQKHIKAVTYHNLEIVETENGLEATVVFDV